jgi:voltage-gated potassium channel
MREPSSTPRSLTEREERAERLADRLDPFMIGLGALWLALWAIEPLVGDGTSAGLVVEVVQNVVWAVFVVEFGARVVAARSTRAFLMRHWWELGVLALPALRFVRILRVIRLARGARVLTSAARITRSDEERLVGRLIIVILVTAITVVWAARLLFDTGDGSYLLALHDAVLAAVGGEPLDGWGGVGGGLEILLVAFHTVVIAALAGLLGEYFLGKKDSLRALLGSAEPGRVVPNDTTP